MNKKSETSQDAVDKLISDINSKTRKHYSAQSKIRIVLDGLPVGKRVSALSRAKEIVQASNFLENDEPGASYGQLAGLMSQTKADAGSSPRL